MNEIVYVCDMETYEMIYMNQKAREQHGIHSLEELEGKKCYELIQGSSSPCALCNNAELQPGHFIEWKYFNPIVCREFLLKDSMLEHNGRHCRIELAIDLTAEKSQDPSSLESLNNEVILNEALRLSLSTSSADKSIRILLEYVGMALHCERICIFEEKEGELYDNTYEWCAVSVSPQIDHLQNIPKKDAASWMKPFQETQNVVIRNLEDIRETDPVIYGYLQPQDIHSLVASPLIYQNKIIGFFGVDNPPENLIQPISALLLIMRHFIVSLLRRRDLIQRLEALSFSDQLTGLGNRHAMDVFAEELDPQTSIGVIYCDVMGLKHVNDTLGHRAGDDLLIRNCACLRSCFPKASLFRIGGDEFLVLRTDISREELDEKTARLRSAMKEQNVLMAIGVVWYPDSKKDLSKLLSEADKLMYEDKRKYYEKNDRRNR
jgi:diguanylate cyclase (GGDEF)-like protein